jgi:hypothetical protein
MAKDPNKSIHLIRNPLFISDVTQTRHNIVTGIIYCLKFYFLGHVHKLHCILFFFVCEAIGTAATPGLLCQPRVIVKMIVEEQMEYRVAGETEVLLENLPQRHFCPSQNPT